MSLYLALNIIAVSIPVLLSFEKHLKFYRRWKFVFPAILITAIPFLIWDVYFVLKNFWGFNPKYLNGVTFFHLPLEEILFFITVPYASMFGYYSIAHHFPQYRIEKRTASIITVILIVIAISLLFLSEDGIYTYINLILFILLCLYSLWKEKAILSIYLPVFPLILIPFFLINGILTGTSIEEQVVWYNPEAIIGLRIFTIPVEDMFYAFSLILIPIILTRWFEKKDS